MGSALIIGAAGQDGRLLTQLLLHRGYSVFGWVRNEPSPSLLCKSAIVDISQEGLVERELRALAPGEIYYLAAFHHSTENFACDNATGLLRRSFDVHVYGLLNVLQAVRTTCQKTRLFYAASSHVFGASPEDCQDEHTPLRPDSPYAISKAAGLRCCQLVREQEDIFAATGILFNHESPWRQPSFVSQKIVRAAVQARRDSKFRLHLGDLDACVDWGYAPDYVDAMFRILQLPAASDFVVASGELHTVREFVELAFGELGLDWREHVESDTNVLKRHSYPLRGDPQRLRAATGWSPTVTFPELVTKLVNEAERRYETA
jgi:GDPmannose 4,6-dehydratase